ncbi:hypothetical protein L486_08059 [Kwoniella mangroviensis CBS 10435]|uniref:Uncharacterized protein n=1 Tax=Kwoniella mangroviensis CBS 10435 TaxID=1331196 RepID=A0A1B9IGQ2_9TREE|nr:hypothetical protein L486_08059 [Kwoniella mangroviensis CBS 10435]
MSSTFYSRFSSFARSSSFSPNLGRSKSWTSGGQSTVGIEYRYPYVTPGTCPKHMIDCSLPCLAGRTGSNNSYFHQRPKIRKDGDKKTLDTLINLRSVGDEYENALSTENHGHWGFLSSNQTDQLPRGKFDHMEVP